jgi:glycosyltransferase involved in cell wall biosynthesis
MKLVFAHDHRFIPVDGLVYSESNSPLVMLEPCFPSFAQIHVLGRQGQMPMAKTVADLDLVSRDPISFSLLPNLSSVGAQLRVRRQVMTAARECIEAADAVVARLPSELGLVAARVARALGKPLAVEIVGCAWGAMWDYGNWQGKCYAPILWHRVRSAVKEANFALYVTRRFLQARYPNPGQTMACSDVNLAIQHRATLDRRLDRIATHEGVLVLGLIGSLRTRHKGIQTVLKALPGIRQRLPGVRFRVLGEGDPEPWRREARRQGVADITSFEGVLKPDAAMAWLDQIDLYLQPSLQEGLPRALIEAMSRGCPAIGSKTGGIPELLDETCMITPGSVTELAQLVVQFASSPDLLNAQAARNWLKASAFSPEILSPTRAAFWAEFARFASQCSGDRLESTPRH